MEMLEYFVGCGVMDVRPPLHYLDNIPQPSSSSVGSLINWLGIELRF